MLRISPLRERVKCNFTEGFIYLFKKMHLSCLFLMRFCVTLLQLETLRVSGDKHVSVKQCEIGLSVCLSICLTFSFSLSLCVCVYTHKRARAHTHTHIYIYIYIYFYLQT
jgi:hypothetical protein